MVLRTLPRACARAFSSTTVPARQTRVVLRERAAGNPEAKHFAVETDAPVPALRTGTVLVKNAFVGVEPAMKGWISTSQNYASVPVGATMAAFGVGRVVASDLDGVAVGDLVAGRTGWQEYGIADPSEPLFRKVEALPARCAESVALGALGINGLTAYLGLETTAPKKGETVLVSTASGGVGSAVGQLARAAGCRAVGLAGGPEKAARCVSDYGYSAAVDYRSRAVADADGLRAAIADACPDGIDVFYDMVGGRVLDAVVPLLNVGGRVLVVGTAGTAAWSPPPLGNRLERNLLVQRSSMAGFLVFDHADRFPGALADLGAMIGAGDLAYDEDVRPGLAAAPAALADLYAGANTGRVLIAV